VSRMWKKRSKYNRQGECNENRNEAGKQHIKKSGSDQEMLLNRSELRTLLPQKNQIGKGIIDSGPTGRPLPEEITSVTLTFLIIRPPAHIVVRVRVSDVDSYQDNCIKS